MALGLHARLEAAPGSMPQPRSGPAPLHMALSTALLLQEVATEQDCPRGPGPRAARGRSSAMGSRTVTAKPWALWLLRHRGL